MSAPNTTADQEIDYSFLLVTHMVCADQQIHSKEAKALHELASQSRMGQRTIEEMEKILAQDEHLLAIEDVARRVSPSKQNEAMRQILALAYIDGFFSPLEREMIEQVGQIWNWSAKTIQRLIEEAQGFTANHSISHDNDKPELSVGARLLKGAESILSRSLVSKLAEIAPENIGVQLEKLQREILLAGPEYDDAIRQCAAIAHEDYKFAEVALKASGLALNHLGKGIHDQLQAIQSKTSKGQAKTATEVAKQLEITKKALTIEIIKEIESVRESLAAKQRALNHFSIAFMGKTKAGKSTLHAIVTGEGWDAIGVGKQRTTRFNRVYEWKNIRIIDTPGIGAPGGKTDEEIAQSVIEESDVICYVVTNDSIQETEFKFLKLLKEKAKPLIVLLNVKNNLRDSRRLEHFLKEPDKLFVMDGKSGLGGHIERIHRYAKQHYANDYFDIVPVLLLAAQLSREPEHKECKDKLFKASRMQDFLDSIRVSLVEHGVIRRSQTLLGSTVGAIENPDKWVTQQAQVYQKLANTLKNKRETIRKNIEKAEKDSLESLHHQIEAVFEDAFNAISYFAEDQWNSNEEGMKRGWNKKLKDIKFEERIDTVYKDVSKTFNKEVTEALEEVGKELQLIAQLGGGSFNFTEQDSDIFMRHAMKIGGSILGLVGSLLFFTPLAPIGWLFIGVGFLAGLFSDFFKSQDQKRREAVTKISDSLSNQLSSQKKDTLQKVEENFKKSCDEVLANIDTYFEELIKGLDAIATQLETAKNKLSGTTNYLNRAYAKRIIDWCCEQHEPLTDEGINRIISKVKRDFGRSMSIQTKSEFKLRKSLDDIKQVLQEDVSILPVKS
ncbi:MULTISPECIES: GTPase [Cyanophyceae]|uniref:GTPase n=1 Tax=Cyanophyceae TaxID=3028117 RepID=UPI001682C556|nr:GTPase [Trichocoleus sp. FACHB-69]MBD1934356.1 50S ribosome-binding GTPase [Trichocoleus sp. FACHB-69]